MPRKFFSDEYVRRMVELVRSGRDPKQLAKEFDVSTTTIYRWVQQAKKAEAKGEKAPLTTDEKEELKRLRREVAKLQEERDILKKFAAWSAQEANWAPKKRSDS